jgi:hypothetical protein
MQKTMLAAFALATGLISVSATADELQMVNPPAAETRVATPSRGSSMGQVERQFGEPSEKVGAVGQPPISRWVYPQFVVYFEYSHVIHAVATHVAAATPAMPAAPVAPATPEEPATPETSLTPEASATSAAT